MREIVLLDTSIFCRILRVPRMCSKPESQAAQWEVARLAGIGATLLLPVAVIYETGNHIAQNGDGDERRKVATRFVREVGKAFEGGTPYTPTPLQTAGEMSEWLDQFPDYAIQGVGLGDLSIIRIFEAECIQHPLARVRIWTDDDHLASYDRFPDGSLA